MPRRILLADLIRPLFDPALIGALNIDMHDQERGNNQTEQDHILHYALAFFSKHWHYTVKFPTESYSVTGDVKSLTSVEVNSLALVFSAAAESVLLCVVIVLLPPVLWL